MLRNLMTFKNSQRSATCFSESKSSWYRQAFWSLGTVTLNIWSNSSGLSNNLARMMRSVSKCRMTKLGDREEPLSCRFGCSIWVMLTAFSTRVSGNCGFIWNTYQDLETMVGFRFYTYIYFKSNLVFKIQTNLRLLKR